MKKMLTKTRIAAVMSGIVFICFWGCQKESIISSTTDAVNLTSYLNRNPETFSELSQILELTGTAAFLNAYGNYTMFAPTNEAVKSYLEEKGKASVKDLGADELKDLVRFHLLEDSLRTSNFTDGKLRELTMYGQYITSGAANVGGVTKYRINGQADIIQPNIKVGNAIIHVVNNVLKPADKTIAQMISTNPRYSIFAQALVETGLYDTLNVIPKNKENWYTIIAESDSAIKAAGFADYDALKLKYCHTGKPKSVTDSLNLFVRYHILNNAKYLADIILSTAHPTKAPLQVITAKLSGQTVLINDDEFNGVHEAGYVLNRSYSDKSAKNGVLHEAKGHFGIKLRVPYPVYYDVTDMPELRKMTAVYGKATYTFSKEESKQFADLKLSSETDKMIYRWGSAGTSNTSYKRDVMAVPIGTSGGRPLWAEFRMPMLIKGKYKVWVGYYAQQQSSSNGGSVSEAVASIGIDGSDERKPLANSRTISFISKRPGLTPDVEENLGWKIYMESTTGAQTARMVGVVDIEQTGRYWLRLTSINGTQEYNNVDMIQFIPIEMDQQYPKFKVDGTPILRP